MKIDEKEIKTIKKQLLQLIENSNIQIAKFEVLKNEVLEFKNENARKHSNLAAILSGYKTAHQNLIIKIDVINENLEYFKREVNSVSGNISVLTAEMEQYTGNVSALNEGGVKNIFEKIQRYWNMHQRPMPQSTLLKNANMKAGVLNLLLDQLIKMNMIEPINIKTKGNTKRLWRPNTRAVHEPVYIAQPEEDDDMEFDKSLYEDIVKTKK